MLPEPTTNIRSAPIIELAARHRIPAIYAYPYQATGGGLISYGAPENAALAAKAHRRPSPTTVYPFPR